jgi:hypothetical protein
MSFKKRNAVERAGTCCFYHAKSLKYMLLGLSYFPTDPCVDSCATVLHRQPNTVDVLTTDDTLARGRIVIHIMNMLAYIKLNIWRSIFPSTLARAKVISVGSQTQSSRRA